jgi:hypothetical protein
MSEEIIKKAIEDLARFNPELKLEIKERREKWGCISDEATNSEFVHDEIEITILRDGERLYTANYFTEKPEYRPLAFERMLQTIILSGLVNHPTVRQLRERGEVA